MFGFDKRKHEVRDRIERNDWKDFELTDFGLVTLIYEMEDGERLKMLDDKDRTLYVTKNDGDLAIVHEDFVIYRAYIETMCKSANFKNEHVAVYFSLVDSRILDFKKAGDN